MKYPDYYFLFWKSVRKYFTFFVKLYIKEHVAPLIQSEAYSYITRKRQFWFMNEKKSYLIFIISIGAFLNDTINQSWSIMKENKNNFNFMDDLTRSTRSATLVNTK